MQTLLFNHKEFNIFKSDKIENIYKIKIKNQIPNFTSSLINGLIKSKLLHGITLNSILNEISFQANSILPLKEYMKTTRFSYEKIQEFISSITIQLKYLQEEEGYSFYGLDLESIIVINNSIFLQISIDFLVPLNKTIISIFKPFSKNFISPELNSQTSLPIYISFHCINYSIAELCIYLLNKEKLSPKNINCNKILEGIEGTKLYWFLKRAIEKQLLIYI
jgi:hypothetical protein